MVFLRDLAKIDFLFAVALDNLEHTSESEVLDRLHGSMLLTLFLLLILTLFQVINYGCHHFTTDKHKFVELRCKEDLQGLEAAAPPIRDYLTVIGLRSEVLYDIFL